MKNEKLYKAFNRIIVVFFISLLIIYFKLNEQVSFQDGIYPKVLLGAIFALGTIAIASELIQYLNKDIGNEGASNNKMSVAYDTLKIEVDSLRKKIDEISGSKNENNNNVVLSEGEQKEIVEGIKKRVVGKLIIDASTDLKKDIQNIREQVNINDHYEDMVIRIKHEIDRLNRRGGSNLGIGSIIALIGMVYLAYTVTNQPVSKDTVEYVIHMIPRLSFVLAIEIFAYFFLKLYKNGFDEVKYFQNELTNIEAKVLAIKFLRDIKNEELMSEVIKSLMTTERNFVLMKGQTTVDLEKERIKGLEDRNIISMVKELIKFKSS